MEGSYAVAAFRSRGHVLRLNEILTREGIRSLIVSTPREISAGCGLSVKFGLEHAGRVKNIVSQMGNANLIGIYLVKTENGVRQRLSPMSIRD
ncbi:MAG: DUF3343 domain-containing protein [Clostridia bacterium]|nr:DUF3343 domain-containing protein [Clostridia bacterium]